MNNKEQQNLYEGMYIISSKLSDEARNKALEKIKNGITSRGGEIMKIHDQGNRRLAYEIDGHREGHYYVMYFKVNPAAIAELWRDYHLSEDLVRFITLTAEEVRDTLEFKVLVEQN